MRPSSVQLTTALFLVAAAPVIARAQTNDTDVTGEATDPDVSIQARTSSDGNAPRLSERRGVVRSVPPVVPLAEADRQRAANNSARNRSRAEGEPDVLLDIPNLSVEELTIDVENLKVHLALDARVANLVTLTAGADASVDKVKITIKGVKAEVHLVVRLDNVSAILDRTLTTIDRNPELLNRLLQSVDKTVGTVGGVANTALQPGGVVDKTVDTVGGVADRALEKDGILSHAVNTLGQNVLRTVDAGGNLLEKTYGDKGIVGTKNVGRLLDLPIVKQSINAAGQVVRQVRDTSGAIIEYTRDASGIIVNTRVVQFGGLFGGR